MNPKIHNFTHNNNEYQIRGAAFEDGFQAAVFLGENKLCENVKISFEDSHDQKIFTGEHGLDFLFRSLEAEVRSGNISN